MQRRQSLALLSTLALAAGCARTGLRRDERAGSTQPTRPALASAEGDSTWLDTSRNRDVPVRVRWPQGDAPCALVVYSHGLGGNRAGGDVWARAWQAAGIAVINVQHPGSDTEVFGGGNRAVLDAANAQQLLARVADMRFVVDEVLRRNREAGAWSRVRADAIGAAGHSFGAQTTQAIAGQRYAASATGWSDSRYRAFIAFSPMVSRNEASSESQQFGAITRPFLCLTGSADGDPLGSDRTAADRARVYDGLPPGQRALLWLDGADHMTFAGNGEVRLTARRGLLARTEGAAELEQQHHAAVAQITTAWWRWRLLGDSAARTALNAPRGLGPKDRWTLG